MQAEELLRRNGEYQAMVTDLQRRLNDARSTADEAADASRREKQVSQVRPSGFEHDISDTPATDLKSCMPLWFFCSTRLVAV